MSVLAQLADLRLRPRPPAVTVVRTAEISACRSYCWSLRREMRDTLAAGESVLPWILLHPPVPDVTLPEPARDHAALLRIMGFTWAWGFDTCLVLHLFAYRAATEVQLGRWLEGPGLAPLLDNITRVAAHLAPFDAAIAAWGTPSHRIAGATRDAIFAVLEATDQGRATPLELFSLGHGPGGYPLPPRSHEIGREPPLPQRLSRELMVRSVAA